MEADPSKLMIKHELRSRFFFLLLFSKQFVYRVEAEGELLLFGVCSFRLYYFIVLKKKMFDVVVAGGMVLD